MKVKLIAWNKPEEDDSRKLVILAVKVSCGKVREKGIDYYIERNYSDKDYRKWLIDALKYPSVLEHLVFTFYIEGISRVCSHQLVRHRLASYTQESQRYSESYMKKAVEKVAHICSKKLKENYDYYSRLIEEFLKIAEEKQGEYRNLVIAAAQEAFVIPWSLSLKEKYCLARSYLESLAEYYRLLAKGVRKEDARFIIPQAIKTALIMTVNLRELLHIAKLRLSGTAQWEIRELVKRMIEEVSKIVPEITNLIKSYRE